MTTWPVTLLYNYSLALITGCEWKPTLNIDGEDHHYTFEEEAEEEDRERLTRGGRRDTRKLFSDLIMYHYVKKRYNTRLHRPTEGGQ